MEIHVCKNCCGPGYCQACHGTGMYENKKCGRCFGTGDCQECGGNGGYCVRVNKMPGYVGEGNRAKMAEH